MSDQQERLVAEEALILDATEAICEVLDQQSDMTRKWLAEQLGCTKSYVTQLLSGERNMTLRTLAQIAHALGHKPEIKLTPATTSGEKEGSQ